MKVVPTVDDQPISEEFPLFRFRMGNSFLAFLRTIDISIRRKVPRVTAAYLPFITIRCEAGQLLIDMPLWRPNKCTSIIISLFPPLIWAGTTDILVPEDEDE
jgi:hypothetical protein